MEMYEFGAFVEEKCCQTFQIKKRCLNVKGCLSFFVSSLD